MEMIGIVGKKSLSPAPEWSSRLAATAAKESINSQDKKIPTPPDSTGISESIINHQEAVKAVADRLVAFLDSARYSLEFIPNPENGRVTIRVLNSAGKVIRQIPPEEIDRFSLQAGSQIGLLFDEKLG
jgi:uncharacterized FlaG/YvyC family protein